MENSTVLELKSEILTDRLYAFCVRFLQKNHLISNFKQRKSEVNFTEEPKKDLKELLTKVL
jgi:hypothetical protein